MRTSEESRKRWTATQWNGGDVTALQRAVKCNGSDSPCKAGLRSVCWKTFLLFRDNDACKGCSRILRETRKHYEALRESYMRFVKHPELLAKLTVDPLAEDPESPWDIFRRDELMRAEILQDVRRLPDDPFYHQKEIQTLILDVLFVFCKEHPDAGGYRQGMHELLSPLVYVLNEDAIEGSNLPSAPAPEDTDMIEMLDCRYIEHDAYTLFVKMMDKAHVFYETNINTSAPANPDTGALGDLLPPLAIVNSTGGTEQSAIVELSREIHEGTLMKVDPELAVHLKNVEILPQIFLIRWIRLLFGREFPFEQHLALWDNIFAFDPSFHLVPLISVAMLLRIRWKLLEGDYSVALQSLLKYPVPQPPNGSHTFVDDAIYLRDHLDAAGGSNLILKYTGRAPSPVLSPTGSSAASTPRPSTPAAAFAAGLGSLRSRTLMAARSPLRSPRQGSASGTGMEIPSGDAVSPPPSKFIPRREGVEALFQGAAKGVFERGEKLGINRAVRDAVGEIKRNMAQSYQEARQAAAATRVSAGSKSQVRSPTLDDEKLTYGQSMRIISEMERRNQQLALMLDETVTTLKTIARATPTIDSALSNSDESEAEKAADLDQCQQQKQWLEEIELAAAKIQFVKVHLEDSSLMLSPDNVGRKSSEGDVSMPGPETKTVPAPTVAALPADPKRSPVGPKMMPGAPLMQSTVPDTDFDHITALAKEDGDGGADVNRMDINRKQESPEHAKPRTGPQNSSAEMLEPANATRPAHTIPTRSSLAQSTFSWMLEPGDSVGSSGNSGTGSDRNSSVHQASPPSLRKPLQPNAASRTRHAFLFGEVVNQSPLGSGDTTLDPLEGSQTLGKDGQRRPGPDGDIFGLEPLRRAAPERETT